MDRVKTARDCLSTRVVTVGPEQRLIDVSEAIVRHDALYCAVVSRSGMLMGLVRLKEIVTRSTNRIFSDLAPAIAPIDVDEKMSIPDLVKLLQTEGIDEVVVLSNGKQYVGLVTRESLFDWWVREVKEE